MITESSQDAERASQMPTYWEPEPGRCQRKKIDAEVGPFTTRISWSVGRMGPMSLAR